uniref:Uncharacterized protein n=1 Tax=Arundo donax TaxID=35708 RepID=A0A0A9F5A8_ARUDO
MCSGYRRGGASRQPLNSSPVLLGWHCLDPLSNTVYGAGTTSLALYSCTMPTSSPRQKATSTL